MFWTCLKLVFRFAFNVCCGIPSAFDAGDVLDNAARSAGLTVVVDGVIGVQRAPLLVVAGWMRCVKFHVGTFEDCVRFRYEWLVCVCVRGRGSALLLVLRRSLALAYECWTARIRRVGLAVCFYRRNRGCELEHCMR